METLVDHLRFGNVHFGSRTFGPRELRESITAVSGYLDSALSSPSPFVFLVACNHVKTVCAYFGIMKARRICVVLEPETGRIEFEEKVRELSPAACIRVDPGTDVFDFGKEIEPFHSRALPREAGDLGGVCTVFFTAADDGYAKAAMLTAENLLCCGRASNEACGIGAGSVLFPVLPLSHPFGLQCGMIMPHIAAADCIIESGVNLTNPTAIGVVSRRHGATHLMAVPVVYYLLSKAAGTVSPQMRGLKMAVSGGCALPETVGRRFAERFGLPVSEGYGLTEAGPSCTLNSIHSGYRPNSVGKELGCCEVRIVDGTNAAAAHGVEGEIVIRGKNVMRGYFGDPGATKEKIRNGWLHTGDTGLRDDEGFIHFVRSRETMANSGGKKIFHREVERLMKMHHSVDDVRVETGPCAFFGHTITAKVKFRKGWGDAAEAELERWMKRSITHYKIPGRIYVDR